MTALTLRSIGLILAASITAATASVAATDKPAAPAAAAQAIKPPAARVAPALKPGTPVAMVNGKPITKAQFDRSAQAMFQKSHGGLPKEMSVEIRSKLLAQLVGQELIYQEASKKPPKDLGKTVEDEYKQIKGSFPTPDAFQQKLKAEGLTESSLKETLAKQVTIRGYVEREVIPNLKVSDADAKKFYDQNKDKMKAPEQVRASHILLLVPATAKPEERQKTLAKAKELQKRAAKGEDFAKLARENSQDPGSAKNGGDLGFFAKEQMVEPFAKAAFSLKTGSISDVVETTFGYHVIKATGRKAAGLRAFDEEKQNIVSFLKSRQIGQVLQSKADALRKTNKVQILVPAP